MNEQTAEDACEAGFDYSALVDELRCHTTEWLLSARAEEVREQRRHRVRELAMTRVLDERGALGEDLAAADGVSGRVARETLETARALGELPRVAAAAYGGAVSAEQLTPLVQLADPESDAEWAGRARNIAPADLARLARTKTKPTPDDAHARRAARELRMWWRRDAGMLAFRGELPDLEGALFEAVINRMTDRMRPVKGQPWERRHRRGADALVELCRNFAEVDAVSAPAPLLVVEVPLEGPAEIAGIPLPDSLVEKLRASAKVEAVLVDAERVRIATTATRAVIAPKLQRAVKLRDGHCRVPGRTRRTGLQVHHLWPRSWGGTDEIVNLAAVRTGGETDHHAQLAPHGPWLLLGNPNRPDGLRLVHRDELAAGGTGDIRAGPEAA